MSTPMKRSKKSKFILEDIEDLLDGSNFIKEPSKTKKPLKREHAQNEEEIPVSGRKYQTTSKKNQQLNGDMCKEVKGKVLEAMEKQADIRKEINANLLNSLSEVMTEMNEDYLALKSNQSKLQQLSTALVKCISQATAAQEQKYKSLNEILVTFKKQCEQMETDQKLQANKLSNELEQDIEELRQKLISETKRSGWENLRKKIFQMESDF